ncbi:MAG TPA: PEP/pyruvate-binding domain-containing protein [Rectinemataceae bacterium]|nr:PEP/pyruvate-binding domain-containing protein [Rectinemataceae bacterium]
MSYSETPIRPALVAPISSFGRESLALAGGKGANLGELTRNGFSVPSGFVVTTAAYESGLMREGLGDKVERLGAGFDPEDAAGAARVAASIREAITQAPLPGALREEILAAYRGLGAGAVAVRSSSTAEDLPDSAFAGQQETFLNVIGEDPLLEAVKECWASLWSERAMTYRAPRRNGRLSASIAVVVQEMVRARSAGVMFTANPLTGEREEILIDAAPGLGVAVVEGLVTPDRFILDKATTRIAKVKLGKREALVRARSGGGTEELRPEGAWPPRPAIRLALPRRAARELAAIGKSIEAHFSCPQDIEWAWFEGLDGVWAFAILQARPMTALPSAIKVNAVMAKIMPMLAEMWPSRPFPLDMTTFAGALESAVGSLLRSFLGAAAPDPDKALVEEDGVVLRLEAPEFRPRPSLLFSLVRALWRTRKFDPEHWASDPRVAGIAEEVRALEERDMRKAAWSENIIVMRKALDLVGRAMAIREDYVLPAARALLRLRLLLGLAASGSRFADLIGGVETKTTETNRALEALAASIREDERLRRIFSEGAAPHIRRALAEEASGRPFLEAFDAFILAYGHRETDFSLVSGTWRDEPDRVFVLLTALVAAPPSAAGSYARWEEARDRLLSRSILGLPLFRPAFLKALRRGRAFFTLREDTHFHATLALPLLRALALEGGRRLAEAGAIEAPWDILHLKLGELEALDETWPPAEAEAEGLRALIARRKAKRESLASTPMVDPRYLAAPQPRGKGKRLLLRGSAGSPGGAVGRARIIRDAGEFGKLLPGEILVAPLTNPSWTPLFRHALAIVVDSGGPASHAAIVAREYGVPAVMGVGAGTSILKDGQRIRVDGSAGTVSMADDDE